MKNVYSLIHGLLNVGHVIIDSACISQSPTTYQALNYALAMSKINIAAVLLEFNLCMLHNFQMDLRSFETNITGIHSTSGSHVVLLA